jgi:hypothetical protein
MADYAACTAIDIGPSTIVLALNENGLEDERGFSPGNKASGMTMAGKLTFYHPDSHFNIWRFKS